jgi:3-oxoadipate enol-lactonase
VLERVAKIEAAGMAFAAEESTRDGYPVELRIDIARVEQYRARWLGNDPTAYATVYRMLVATEMHDELTRLTCPTLVIGGSLSIAADLAKAVADVIPHAVYVEVRTGHAGAAASSSIASTPS